MENKKEQKKDNTRKKYILKLSILLILFAFSILFFILAYKFKNKNIDNLLYVKNINEEINYKVFLYDNSFIEKEYLEKNEMYISDLVKSIEGVFKYNFNTSKNLNLSYEYEISSTIYGEYKESSSDTTSKVWEKPYVLLDKKSVDLNNSTGFDINEVVNIDYTKYNNEVSEFRKTLKLPLNAYLIVKMNVKVFSKADDGSKKIEDEGTQDINIPLNQLAFKILQNYESSRSIPVNTDSNDKPNYIFLALGIFTIIIEISLIIFIPSYRNLIFKKDKNSFENVLKKTLKQYGDIIIETTSIVDISNKQIVDIKDINEMIDLEEELRIPILLYRLNTQNEAWFIISHESNIYRYILKDENINNINNIN
jgi:hypothetical protein